MKFVSLLLTATLLLATAGVQAQAKDDYKVGDRLPQAATDAKGEYREIRWDALTPKDWDPMKDLRAMNFGMMSDADPRANDALKKMQDAWANAPVEPSMNGQRVRIPGFAVPLEFTREEIREFLLVPYFGACIHTPPPPANQIIHVKLDKPVKVKSMEAVWVNGTLRTEKSQADVDTGMAAAGYQMKADLVAPYVMRK